jgi:hypothetical protein
MTHDMKLQGGMVVMLSVLLASGCYGTPRTSFPDDGKGGGGGGGTGANGASGTGGASGGGGVSATGGASGGASGTGGAGGTGGSETGGVSGRGGSGTGGAIGVGDGGTGGGTAGAASSGRGGASGGGAAGAAGSGGTGGSSACSPACDATHVCSGGHCLLADAQQCVTGSQCASGACNPFYADVDGDGYGAGQPVGFCTLTSPPIGYTAQTGDCCDSAANLTIAKLIHPGADFQTTSAGGICNGIAWDYDCSGTVDSDPTTIACAWNGPTCDYTLINYAESSCGNSVLSCGCAVAGPACMKVCSGTPGKVSCK